MASKKLSAGSLAMFDEAMADGTADEMANDFFGSASTPVAQPAEEPDGSTPVQPEPRRLSENTMAMFDDMFSGAGDADVKRSNKRRGAPRVALHGAPTCTLSMIICVYNV